MDSKNKLVSSPPGVINDSSQLPVGLPTQTGGGLIPVKPSKNPLPWRVHDLTGRKFGRLTVISFSHSKSGVAFWDVQCDCGAQRRIRGMSMVKGRTRSCGCLKKETDRNKIKPIDLTGQRFGKLEVLALDKTRRGHGACWHVLCACGKLKSIEAFRLKAKHYPADSCGCLGRERIRAAKFNPALTEEDRARYRRGSLPYQHWTRLSSKIRRRDSFIHLLCLQSS